MCRPAVAAYVHAQSSAHPPIASWRSACCGSAAPSFSKDSDSRSLDLHQLPDTDFRIHTLDLVGVSMGAWGLRDEILRWPALPQPESALSERAAVVRPAQHAGGRHDRALQRLAESREVRAQQARADLHPDGRHGRQADDACPGSRKCGCTRRACRATRSRRSPS